MRTALARLVAAAALGAMAGCSLNATMMPVEGPLSLADPVPTLKVKADGIWGNSGRIAFALPNGERCEGRWASAAGTAASVSSTSLLSEYGPLYLTGYTVSTDAGQNPGLALASCDRGSSFQLEFVTGSGSSHGFGIGKDNRGNVYRFVF